MDSNYTEINMSVNLFVYLLIYLLLLILLLDILYKEGDDFMGSVLSAITNTIPISLFNRGLAGKIFEEVKQCGAKVVMKNNAAECVLLSPDEYVRLMDEVNDARLLAVAMDRFAKYDPTNVITEEEIYKEFGITENDLAGYEEVELE